MSTMSALPGFELFTGQRAKTQAPAATIHAKGVFALNEALLNEMGQPQAVVFLFNPSERLIALQPVEVGAAHSRQVRYPNRSSKTAVVSAKAFLDSCGIASEQAVQLGVRIENSIAILSVPSEAFTDGDPK